MKYCKLALFTIFFLLKKNLISQFQHLNVYDFEIPNRHTNKQ